MTLSPSPPPDPGESGTGPPLRVIETDDIEIFSDLKWIQPGRFSDILYGYCHSLAETVALKRLRVPDDGVCSARDLRLFNEEATIWHTLDHPHVLPLRGIYVCPAGFTYLVSPYMNNGDLMSYLKHNPLVDRRGLLCDIASAIAYLHSLEIVHGDIKARNILVSQDGDVRLCDFGLSKYSSWTTSEGRKGAGTIRWQSPELLFDESKSFKSDVYAFGITIYEVLSGNIPFGASSDGAIVYNVVLRNTRPPCLPKFSPTGQSYATTWALARECWHRVPDSRPDMVQVWKRLEMEVFPDVTLRVMVAEKERMASRSAKVFKGGTSATGGVGPPRTAAASAAGRGRTFTVDAADEGDEEAEESDNELGLRRHTIDIDSMTRPHLSRTVVEPERPQFEEPTFDDRTLQHLYSTGGSFVEGAAADDDDDEEEPEFLFTPNDSPLLGATEGPVYRTGRGGLLPSNGELLEAIDEDFTLDGGDGDDDRINDVVEAPEAQPPSTTTRILSGVPAKDSKSLGHTKRGASSPGEGSGSYLGAIRNPVGAWMPWSSRNSGDDSSPGGRSMATQRQSRRKRIDEDKNTKDGEEDEEDGSHHKIIEKPHSIPSQMCSDVGSNGYYNSIISAINSAYECTKSMIIGGGNTKSTPNPQKPPSHASVGGSQLKRVQPTKIDWTNWDGISSSTIDKT